MDMALPEEATAVPAPTVIVPTWQPRPLPMPATPFIGRETELVEIAELLANPDCRLLTIVGLGGMGKTRLALQTADGHRPIFRDGVAFVPLAPLQIADLLTNVIGDVLQLNFSPAMDPRDQLFNFLSQKEMLLVLDNFEHLLESAEILAILLSAAPRVKLLVTSRQRLDLQGEWVYEIGGLPLPDADDSEALAENSAIALFQQSARRVDNRQTPTPDDERHIVRICRLVGGMPLAIELAATWVRLLSYAEIAEEIEQSLDFLAASLRNIPERHRSIQAVFDYSWGLLTPQEQEVLAQLSVFRGGFTREAAEWVAKATLTLLSALVDKSLVRRNKNGQYDLHELIRQYAQEQLIRSDKFAETSERHFEFFLEMAEQSKVKLRSSEQIEWLKRLEQDYDNLRAALEWSLQAGMEAQKSLRLTAALYFYWKLHANWSNGRKWLHQALVQTAQSPPTQERAEAINAAALLAVEQADKRVARQLAEEGLALAQKLENPYSTAQALNSLGLVLWKQKDHAMARANCEEALALFRNLGKKINIADVLKDLGRIATNQNDLESARVYFEESLAIYQSLGNQLEYNWVLSDLGLLAYLRNDFATARLYQEKSLKLFREVRSIAGTEMALNRLGDVARCENDFDEAEKCYSECLTAYEQTADKDEIPSLLHNLGYVAKHRGEYARAISLFRKALTIHMETGNQGGITECLAGIAAVLIAQGQTEHGALLFGAVEALREKNNLVFWPANQLEYESSLATLHDALAETSLVDIWAAGRALAMEQIYDFVFSDFNCIEGVV
jgi:predicted ATPase